MIAELPDPGRPPAIAATLEQDLTAGRANPDNGRVVKQPCAAELAALRCLATGLSRREIGARLYVSLNTVKTHTRELYRKLDASSREDAVARAAALGLLRPHRITRVILAPNRPFRGHDQACLALDVTASLPSRRRRRAGTTVHLRFGRNDGLCT